MRKRNLTIGGVAVAVVIAAATFVGLAVGGDGENDQPITGPAYQQAVDAALAHTGEGKVTETEVGDEESLYEVEVTLPNGNQVDVQLDESFAVVGAEADEEGPNDTDSDGQ
ncbi:MAG: PepSY domain-containing protein [Thermoleophilia bacterium]|nr:PepSY domain-containing protein [Thermoleophilia bacterium]